MVGTKLHSCIDIGSRSKSFLQNASCFIDHWDQDAVNNKARSFFNFYWSFTNSFRSFDDGFFYFVRSICTGDNFYQFHTICWVEEVHADYWVFNAVGDFSNGQRRSIGSEDSVFFNDVVEFVEYFFFQRHLFESSFND